MLAPKAPTGSIEEQIRKRQIDQLIFEKIQTHWEAGCPLSITPSTGDRYLPRALGRISDFEADELKAAMLLHIDGGNLKVDQKTTRSLKGLCIKRKPPHVANDMPTG